MSERSYQIIIAALVVVIIILGFFAMSRRSVSSLADTNETASSTADGNGNGPAMQAEGSNSNSTASNGESITVNAQAAGNSVKVATVTLSKAGWIAVRDSKSHILGAGWLPAGTHNNVSVPLLRATTAGASYQVQLYVDNGDKKFDMHKDILISGSQGGVAGTTFSAK